MFSIVDFFLKTDFTDCFFQACLFLLCFDSIVLIFFGSVRYIKLAYVWAYRIVLYRSRKEKKRQPDASNTVMMLSAHLTWNEINDASGRGEWQFSVMQYVTQATQQHAMPHYPWRYNHSRSRLTWWDVIGCKLQQLCLVNIDACRNVQNTFSFISARPHICSEI